MVFTIHALVSPVSYADKITAGSPKFSPESACPVSAPNATLEYSIGNNRSWRSLLVPMGESSGTVPPIAAILNCLEYDRPVP